MHHAKLFLVLLLFHLHDLSQVAAAGGDGGQFVYNGFAGERLDLDGMALVEPDGKLMLTNATSQLKGHAFHPASFRFHHHDAGGTAANNGTRSFSTTFVFAIVSEYVTVSGNGLAFFVAPSKNLSTASPSQFLGLFNARNNGNDSNRIFAVELDTILNPEFRDINSNHVGVNVNGLVSVAAEPAGYFPDENGGAFRNLSLFSGEAIQVWADYDGSARVLNVTLAPEETPKPKRPLISVAVDLSSVVSDTAYVGLSSSTGPYRTRHYVLGWSFMLDAGAAPPLDYAKLPRMPRVNAKRRPRALDAVLPVALPLAALALVAGAALLAWRRLRYAELREDWETEFGPHRFSYKDLFRATDGFMSKHLLGVGGFGRVYKGALSSKTDVAVKIVTHDTKQGMKQFVAEVVSIGRLRHRNVVQLLGYCRRRGELLLVYDYMPNGSLDRWLYDHRDRPPLSWARRFHVIRGVAAGLLYLHEDWEQVVVHRDVKASNVLLDCEMNARLGDFGLARLYDRGGSGSPQTTHVVGTMGYLAPELAHTRRATPATDVFAFGSFVLEVACGRRPIERDDSTDDGRLVLTDRVLELWHRGALADAADPRLCGDYPAEEMTSALKLGLLCSHPLPAARPTMRQVVQYLDGDAKVVPDPPPSYHSYTVLAMMHNEGFDSYAMSYASSATTAGASSSDLSGGR